MCGICGFVGDRRFELLEPMTSVIAHRGPDDSGTWSDAAAEVGLGFRRLAIIDLSPAGHQPMSNEDGSVQIVFNGEIYDYAEHRRKLLERGHRFKSKTDTEVLVHLYEDLGPEFLSQINGMFALALWDGAKRRLLLARDHAGIKPLYYWSDGRKLYFASEIKSLLKVPEAPRELHVERLPEFLTLLWVPGDETLLRGIRKLEPGHYLVWEDGRDAISPYWRSSPVATSRVATLLQMSRTPEWPATNCPPACASTPRESFRTWVHCRCRWFRRGRATTSPS